MYRTILTMMCFNLIISLNAQTFKLSEENTLKGLTIINRKFKVINENNITFLKFDEEKSEGIVWLPIEDFASGVVEIKMRGKNELQKSFIGIAFHGVDEKRYDAVYCRPFNFETDDAIRKIHAIQYVSHPVHTWKKLREEQNGKYEKGIANAPSPDDWFILKLKIKKNKIISFVNNRKALSIKKIDSISNGKIGIFMASNSGGDFEFINVKKD